MSLLLGVPVDPTGIDQASDRTKDVSRRDPLSIFLSVVPCTVFDECMNNRWSYPCGVLVSVEPPAL